MVSESCNCQRSWEVLRRRCSKEGGIVSDLMVSTMDCKYLNMYHSKVAAAVKRKKKTQVVEHGVQRYSQPDHINTEIELFEHSSSTNPTGFRRITKKYEVLR